MRDLPEWLTEGTVELVREFRVYDYDQPIYVGTDEAAARAAWATATYPDCFVNVLGTFKANLGK